MGTDEQVKLFKARLKQATKDPKDFVAFREILSLAIYTFDLTVTEICDEFAAARPTVARWIMGTSNPSSVLVKAVYRWLEKKLKEETHVGQSQKKQRKGTSSKA